MLESITWKQFILGVSVALIIWYLAIILLYYKKEFADFISGKQKKPAEPVIKEIQQESAVEDDQAGSFDELEETVNYIRHSILEKAGQGVTKEELLRQISNSVTNFSGLRRPAFRVALGNFIIRNAEDICGVTFSEEELDDAWERLPR